MVGTKRDINMASERPEILLVDHGLANNYGSVIEINKDLKEYPELYNYVLSHELKHTDKEFSFTDLKNDFKFSFKTIFKLMFFVLKRPKVWSDFLPIYRRDNKLFYDLNLIISYSLVIILSVILLLIIF